MKLKYLSLNDTLYGYLTQQRSGAVDSLLDDLRTETEALGDDLSKMQISREQGSFMTLLVAAIGAESALEVGTFTGYSSICTARGLKPSGKLLCLDASREWTDIARKYWKRGGLDQKVELRVGPAIAQLRNLEPNRQFDFAFIDAQKTEYDIYYELILPRVRPNGLILFDNMLRGGRVGAGPLEDSDDLAIDFLNKKLATDSRVQSVLLPIADGLQLSRKL